MKFNKTIYLFALLFLIVGFTGGIFFSDKTAKIGQRCNRYFEGRTKKKLENALLSNFKTQLDTLPDIYYSLIDTRYHREPNLKEYLLDFPLHEYSVVNVGQETSFFINLEKEKNDCIKQHLINNCPWENHLSPLIKKHVIPGTIVLDIGAHIGTHTINLAKWVEEGTVYAFEPQPKIFRELFYNLSINDIQNVKLFKCAVGSENGKIELSPLAEGNEGGTPILGGSGVFADLLTIDSLNLNNVSLIKIDVEGMEDKVLEGAKETILRNKPIIFIEFTGYELLNTEDENIIQKAMEKISKLEKLGYFIQNLSHHDYVAYPYRTPAPVSEHNFISDQSH